jgi:hypothetical protein
VRRGAARPRRSDQVAAGETLSRAGRRPHRRACMGCRAPQAPSTGIRLGVPACGRSAWRPRRSGCRPCRRHPVRVLGQRPVSGVRCPVRASSVHACLSQRRVSGVRCHPSVQVSAVRGPVWASGVCALPRPLCPAGVRSWSAAVGRQPYGWDGRGRRGRPLCPCPARGLPESEPRARSWRRRCWASRGFGLDLAVVVGGSWAVASSTAWPTRIGRVHARIIRWWAPARSELAFCGRLIGMRRANRSAGLAG